MPRSSKRKRGSRVLQAEILDEDVEVVSEPEDDGEVEIDAEESQHQEDNGDANHRFEVEVDIWDSFREEFHEAVEQLPLYMHRSYALLRELDQQVTGNYNQIHPTLQKYILLRRSLVSQEQQDPKPNGVVVKEQSPAPESEVKPASDTAGDSKPSPESTEAHFDPAPSTTRELLRHLGWLMEEVVRGSHEKVGLAQAAYDSVDRHIRLLEQSIREQEMSISFGLRQGTHPSLLPDLAAPSRWARATRVAQSPIPGLSDDEDITDAPPVISAGGEVTIGMATGSGDVRASSFKKSKKAKKRRISDKVVSEAEAVTAAGASTAASSSRSLKLKVPPLNAIMQGDAAADPNEPKYCYCNRVSFGNMVACDYPQCKREWFHLACVGLTELPQSQTWYCEDCEPLVRKGDPSGPRRRGR